MNKKKEQLLKKRSHVLKTILIILSNIITVVTCSYVGNYILTKSQFQTSNELNVFLTEHFNSYLFGLFMCLIIVSLIVTLVGDSFIGGGLAVILALVLGFINANKLQARQAPLYPEELLMASEAGALSKMVNHQALLMLIGKIVIILVASFLIFYLKRRFNFKLPARQNLRIRIAMMAILIFPLSQFPKIGTRDHYLDKYFKKEGIDVGYWGWNQPGNYDANGFVLGFAFNAIPQDIMEKPEDYSEKK